jgi:single-strand DNA-binding protein
MNRIFMIGRLVRDIEIKSLQGDKKVGNFTLAVNRDSNRERVDFISCTAWNKTAEVIAKYTSKGSQVLVEGELNIDKVNDQWYTKVTVNRVELLGKSSEQSSEAQTSKPYETPVQEEAKFEDFETETEDFKVEEDTPF